MCCVARREYPMGIRVTRVLAVAVLCVPWLAGCESWNKSAWWNKPPEPAAEAAPPAEAPPPEVTGTVDPLVTPLPGVTPATHGDIESDLNLGKRHFREGE